jgi:hypothetical protein
MTSIAQKQFSFGTVISQSISVFTANLVPFVIVSLLLLLPLLIYNLLAVGAPTAGFSGARLLAIVIQMILSQLLAATISFATFQYLRGQPVGIGECLSRGLSLIGPVFGVAFLAGLIIGVGLVLLVVPGIIAAVMLWIAIPAAVVERPGVVASLKRSADLTKGYRWTIFGILFVIGLILIIATIILSFVLLSAAGFTVFSIGAWVLQAIFGAFSATLAAVGYYFLRATKEGVDIADIAKVFD